MTHEGNFTYENRSSETALIIVLSLKFLHKIPVSIPKL